MRFAPLGALALACLLAAPATAAPGLDEHNADVNPAERRIRIAQAGPAARRGKRMRPNHQKRAKIRQRIRALRAWRLTEALNLDEKSAVRLFPVLNKYDEKLAKLAQKRQKARKQLRQQLQLPKPSNQRINQLIDESMKLEARAHRLKTARFTELRRVLTAAQSAKLMVVLPQIDGQIRRQIRRAMRQGKGQRGARGGPDRWRKNPFGGPDGRRRRPARYKNPFDGPQRGGPAGKRPRQGRDPSLSPGF